MSSAQLASAVDGMADTLMAIRVGNAFSAMTCEEIESIAAVFVIAGRTDAAGHVIMMHGDGDGEPEDVHHDIFRALLKPNAGFSHDEDDEPFRLAMAHVRDLI